MNIRLFLSLIVIGICVLFQACSSDDDVVVVEKNRFEGCCDPDDVVQYSVGDAQFYIPNMHTPNFDGINDVFFIHGGPGLKSISNVLIRDFKDSLIFESPANVLPNSLIWESNLGDGSVYQGMATFEFTASDTNNLTETIIGKTCFFACDTSVLVIEQWGQCVFGTQHTSTGTFDAALPNFEHCDP